MHYQFRLKMQSLLSWGWLYSSQCLCRVHMFGQSGCAWSWVWIIGCNNSLTDWWRCLYSENKKKDFKGLYLKGQGWHTRALGLLSKALNRQVVLDSISLLLCFFKIMRLTTCRLRNVLRASVHHYHNPLYQCHRFSSAQNTAAMLRSIDLKKDYYKICTFHLFESGLQTQTKWINSDSYVFYDVSIFVKDSGRGQRCVIKGNP